MIRPSEAMIDSVKVELIDSRSGDPERYLSDLSVSERRVCSRFTRAEYRASYIAAHARLRQLLSDLVGCEPWAVPIVQSPCPRCGGSGGRPELAQRPLPVHFSITHSKWLVAIAVSESARVGVDIQSIHHGLGGIARQLHPVERVQVGESALRLARCWTRKEASLKALGIGVAHGIQEPLVGAGDQPVQPLGYELVDLEVPPEFYGAVAILSQQAEGVR